MNFRIMNARSEGKGIAVCVSSHILSKYIQFNAYHQGSHPTLPKTSILGFTCKSVNLQTFCPYSDEVPSTSLTTYKIKLDQDASVGNHIPFKT
jgi:hypothetical protein